MTDLEERWDRLARHLGPALGAAGDVTITDTGAPEGIGYSAETLLFTATYPTTAGDVSRRLVLRAETPEPAIYPAQVEGFEVEIEIQHRVMTALAEHTALPVAPILATDLTGEAIGTPFFVMDFVEGVVPPVDPPYPAAGFFAEARPEERRRMVADGVRALAEVHAVDWRGVGLDWLVPAGSEPTLRRQLDLWETQVRDELRGRHHPAIEEALAVLHAELPEPAAARLCWGDPRLGNIIWKDFLVASLTDWEAASIAPAELDLGWWLMFDRSCHEVGGHERLPGEPTAKSSATSMRRPPAAMWATPTSTSCSPPSATRPSWCGSSTGRSTAGSSRPTTPSGWRTPPPTASATSWPSVDHPSALTIRRR